MKRHRVPWLTVVVSLVMLFLYAPLFIVVVFSFNSGRNLSWPPQGISLRWYGVLFADAGFQAALKVSAITAGASAVLAGTIGSAAALVLSRTTSRLAQGVGMIGLLPVMLPPLLVGVGAITVMTRLDIVPGYLTIVLGQSVLVVPFVLLVVLARMRTLDPELESAARDLGSNGWEAFVRVVLPIVAPAVVGASLLAFAWSFDEVLLTSFTSGSLSTVPIYLLGVFRLFVDPSVNAVATLLLVVPWVILVVGAWVLRRTGTTAADILGSEN